MSFNRTTIALTLAGLFCSACSSTSVPSSNDIQENSHAIVGTTTPFASEAVYFVVTDRFVDGDPSNNHEEQGGDHPTWQLPLEGPEGKKAYVGYMGGDLQGILNNAEYIKEMGFTAVWMTPVHDNPDYAFNGDEPITYGGAFKDGGKTGYHGYWATNFYKADEHLVSANLSVSDYTAKMRQHGLKSVFDIVANHGTPSFTMEKDLPGYGEIYDSDGNLVADPRHAGDYLRHPLQPVRFPRPAIPTPGPARAALRADRRAERHRGAGHAVAGRAALGAELEQRLPAGRPGGHRHCRLYPASAGDYRRRLAGVLPVALGVRTVAHLTTGGASVAPRGPLHQRADLQFALAQAQVVFAGLEQQGLVVDAQLLMFTAFGLAAVQALARATLQALVALLARLHLEAQQVDVGDAHLVALPGFQGTALQRRRVGEGRGRQHDVLALLQVRAMLAVEQPAATQIALQADAALAVVVDLEPEAAEAPACVTVDQVVGNDAVALDHLHEVAGRVDAVGILTQAQGFHAGGVPGFPYQGLLHRSTPCRARNRREGRLRAEHVPSCSMSCYGAQDKAMAM